VQHDKLQPLERLPNGCAHKGVRTSS